MCCCARVWGWFLLVPWRVFCSG